MPSVCVCVSGYALVWADHAERLRLAIRWCTYCEQMESLDLLDMHDIADQIVAGSSMEKMKRLTIGVELVVQPSVLFLMN